LFLEDERLVRAISKQRSDARQPRSTRAATVQAAVSPPRQVNFSGYSADLLGIGNSDAEEAPKFNGAL
jgi:hypothetical protein